MSRTSPQAVIKIGGPWYWTFQDWTETGPCNGYGILPGSELDPSDSMPGDGVRVTA